MVYTTIPRRGMLRTILRPIGFPRWFVVLNYIALLPIVAWPVMFFLSWFLFDAPGSEQLGNYLTFFLFILYPVILVSIVAASYRLFARHRPSAIALTLFPIVVTLACITVVVWVLNTPA
jgi:hypothetical protein